MVKKLERPGAQRLKRGKRGKHSGAGGGPVRFCGRSMMPSRSLGRAGGVYGLGAYPGLSDGDGGLGVAGAERVSRRRKPHHEGPAEGAAEAVGRRARRSGQTGRRLGRKVLADIATVAQLDTILGWYGELAACKFDGSAHRGPGRTARSWHRHPAKHFRRLPQDHRRLIW